MSTFVSAGVFSREVDLSLYVAQLSSTIHGLCNTFTRGPMNVATLITSENALTQTFGPPTPDSQGWYAAREYLRQGNNLQVVRAGRTAGLAYSTVSVLDALSAATITVEGESYGSFLNGAGLAVTAGTQAGTVKLTLVDINSVVLEQYDNINKANCEANINGVSEYIQVTNILLGGPGEPATGQALTFAGGTDGISGLTSSDVIGTSGPTGRTGLQALANADAIDLTLLSAPGFSSAAVAVELLNIAAARADVLALVDGPYGLDYTQIIDWHNGVAPYDDHTAFNSGYGMLTAPWLEVSDPYNDVNVWSAPSGHVSRVMAYNDEVGYPWFAPAGLRRGLIRGALRSEWSAIGQPDQAARDAMCGPGQNVNCIVNFAGDGLALYSQKTLQRAPTALDRVNVRRGLNFIKKTIAKSARYLVFEQNDSTMWREFVGLVEPVLRDVLKKRGLNNFHVVMDSTTVTPLAASQNRAPGKIYLEFTPTAEQLELDFILTPQGAEFSELFV